MTFEHGPNDDFTSEIHSVHRVLYLTLHLRHLSGKLDLCGVGELRVKRGGGSFNQHLRAIVHLREREYEGKRQSDRQAV